ncbi:MAG: OprO/OprP family phosphate-selective porin [Pirellulales bacterium]
MKTQWLLLAMIAVVANSGNAQEYDPSAQYTEASYSDLEKRLEALETSFILNEETAAAADNTWKDVDIISKPTLKWTGRVHFDYWGFPKESALPNYLEEGDENIGPKDAIGFRRLRLGLKGDISETMLYKIEFDFGATSKIAIKDAYIGWTDLPFLRTLLIGHQKRPYGLDHLNSSRYNVFMERPFIIEAYNQDARRAGLQSYGVSENEAWNWRFGVMLMEDFSQVGNQRTDNYQPEIAGRLANTIWYDEYSGGRGYAHWAISGTAAFPGNGDADVFKTPPESRTGNKWLDTGDLSANSYQLIGLESVVNIGAFQLTSEYMATQVQRAGGAGNDLSFSGGYVQTSYWLTGEHTPWDRKYGTIGRTKPFENFFIVRDCNGCRQHGWGAWQVAARYSHADFTDEDIFGGVGDSFTLGVNWWWSPNSRMQFNYINGSISERVVAGAPSTDGWYNVYGMRFAVDF